MTSPEKLARVVLSHACEPGDLTSASLVHQLGGQGAMQAQLSPKADSTLHERIAAVDPERVLREAGEQGIRFVVPGEAEWPSQLDDLVGVEHHGLGGVPPGLWVRGPATLARLGESVAVVGARSCSTYGQSMAATIAAGVGRAGFVVVSGGALGIDAAAHDGALGARTATVAVLARGLDAVYPASNAPLLWHLAREHALVSEQAPGSQPTRLRFLARNRLIAALTSGTVLVEAAIRSGALNTAQWAEALSRDVMGVPGPVTSAASAGVHERIRNGGAVLVTDAGDVLEVLGAPGEHLVPVPRAPERRHDRLSREDQRVYEAVPGGQPAPVTAIAHEVARHVRVVDSALRRLQAQGLVRLDDTGWVVSRLPGARAT